MLTSRLVASQPVGLGHSSNSRLPVNVFPFCSGKTGPVQYSRLPLRQASSTTAASRSSTVARGFFGMGSSTTTKADNSWWKQNPELWVEIHNIDEFNKEVLNAPKGTLVAVDWFASWCKGCEKSYPEICRTIMDKDLRKDYKFVKICIDSLGAFAREQGVTALPRMSVFRAGDGRLITMDVTFSKVKNLKYALKTIANPDNKDKDFVLDPNGWPAPVAKGKAAKVQEEKAKAVEELESSKGGLFEHLQAVARSGSSASKPSSATPGSAAATPASATSSNGSGAAKAAVPAESAWPASLNLPHVYNLEKRQFLAKYGSDYGYGGRIDELYPREVGARMKPHEHYLDYTGSSVYCQSQLDAVFEDLRTHMFGNPHSANPSSKYTSDRIDEVRLEVLKYFNADPAEYQVVFTRSATGALKMVGETFPWEKESMFRYLRENHNSVLGIREYALKNEGTFQAVDEAFVEGWTRSSNNPEFENEAKAPDGKQVMNLFAFPAEDNFAGVKYPLSWITDIREKTTPEQRWMVLVDAAAYAGTQPLDLSEVHPDFLVCAFYKMFGYPTGLGALLVRVEAVPHLRKVFWGGGTVALATSKDNFHVLKCRPSDKLEDGTVAFLDIMSLKHGFAMVNNLGGVAKIQSHVAALTEWTYDALSALRYPNGQPMVKIFGKHHYPNRRKVQGGILNFEMLKPDGSIYSYKTFERKAADAGFHVRTGAECNPGACYTYLGVEEKEVESLAGEKEGCEDDVEFVTVERPDMPSQTVHSSKILQDIAQSRSLVVGHPAEVAMKWVKVPLGSVRASLGYMSTFEDCWTLVNFVKNLQNEFVETQQTDN